EDARVEAGGQVGRHGDRAAAGQIQDGAGPGQVQAGRVGDADRLCRVGLVGPVAVRVEVLGAVQGAAEAFDRVALGPAGDAAAEGAVEADVRLAGDQFAGGVEQPGGRADALGEALAQVVHAALELGGGRGAGLRVAGDVQEVGVVAVRVRVAGLVEVGRADRAEGAGVSGELVDGARLKA